MSYWRKPGEQSPPIPFIDAVCRFYSNVGRCPNGDSCSFFHSYPDHRRGWKNYPKSKVNKARRREESRWEFQNAISDSVKVVVPSVLAMWESERIRPPEVWKQAASELRVESEEGTGDSFESDEQQNAEISWALKEIHLLRLRILQLEAYVRALQQNARGDSQPDPEMAGMRVDEDLGTTRNHSTIKVDLIDLQSQIDDLFEGNRAMELGIRGIRESIFIPSSPTPSSSPVGPVGLTDISRLHQFTLDLSTPPPSNGSSHSITSIHYTTLNPQSESDLPPKLL